MEFSIAVDHSREPGAVVVVEGDVDVYSAPLLRKCLVELMGEGSRNIVVDLGRVDFLDSAGLGVLLGAFRRLESLKGELTLLNPAKHVIKLLQTTGFISIFRVEPPV